MFAGSFSTMGTTMAQTTVIFHSTAQSPVVRLNGAIAEVLNTSTASSTPTATSASAGPGARASDGGFATVVTSTANVWVDTGAAPVAARPTAGGAAGTGFPVLAGQAVSFAIKAGHKIACREF